jgi:hypothetical protein
MSVVGDGPTRQHQGPEKETTELFDIFGTWTDLWLTIDTAYQPSYQR